MGKTKPPDYVLMFSSANVPASPYKINLGDLLSSIFGKKIFESSTKANSLLSATTLNPVLHRSTVGRFYRPPSKEL